MYTINIIRGLFLWKHTNHPPSPRCCPRALDSKLTPNPKTSTEIGRGTSNGSGSACGGRWWWLVGEFSRHNSSGFMWLNHVTEISHQASKAFKSYWNWGEIPLRVISIDIAIITTSHFKNNLEVRGIGPCTSVQNVIVVKLSPLTNGVPAHNSIL